MHEFQFRRHCYRPHHLHSKSSFYTSAKRTIILFFSWIVFEWFVGIFVVFCGCGDGDGVALMKRKEKNSENDKLMNNPYLINVFKFIIIIITLARGNGFLSFCHSKIHLNPGIWVTVGWRASDFFGITDFFSNRLRYKFRWTTSLSLHPIRWIQQVVVLISYYTSCVCQYVNCVSAYLQTAVGSHLICNLGEGGSAYLTEWGIFTSKDITFFHLYSQLFHR